MGLFQTLAFMRQGKAELRISQLTSVPSVSSKQLCALSHQGYTPEAGTSASKGKAYFKTEIPFDAIILEQQQKCF